MRIALGAAQRAAVEIYLLDPTHDGEDAFPGLLDGNTLIVEDDDKSRAFALLIEAGNSADCDGDRQLRDALGRISGRLMSEEIARERLERASIYRPRK